MGRTNGTGDDGHGSSSRPLEPAPPETPSKGRKRNRVRDDLQDENAPSPLPLPPPQRSPRSPRSPRRGGVRSPHARSPHRGSSSHNPSKSTVHHHRTAPRTNKGRCLSASDAFDDQPLVFSRGAERERQRIRSLRPLVTQRPTKSATSSSSLLLLPNRDRNPFATPRRDDFHHEATPVCPLSSSSSSDARLATPHAAPPPPPPGTSDTGPSEMFTLSSLTNMLMSAPRERKPPRVSSPLATPLHHPPRRTAWGPGPSTNKPFSTPLFKPSSSRSSGSSGSTGSHGSHGSHQARTEPRPSSTHLVPRPGPAVGKLADSGPSSSRCPPAPPILKRKRASPPASPWYRPKPPPPNGVRLGALARRAQEDDHADSCTDGPRCPEGFRTSMVTHPGTLDLPAHALPPEPAAAPKAILGLPPTHTARDTPTTPDFPTGSEGSQGGAPPDSAIKRLIAIRTQRRKNRTVPGGLVHRAMNVLQRARSQHVLWAAEQQTSFLGRFPPKPVPTIFQDDHHLPNTTTTTTKPTHRAPTTVLRIQSVLRPLGPMGEGEAGGPVLARCVPLSEGEGPEEEQLVLFSPCFSHPPSLDPVTVPSGCVRSALSALWSWPPSTPNQPLRIATWDATLVPISHPLMPPTEVVLCTRFALHKV